jgi:hypothetical protein
MSAPPSFDESEARLREMGVPLALRRVCREELVELSSCRVTGARSNIFGVTFGGACAHAEHIYEACMYKDYVRRGKKGREIMAAAAAQQQS